jgi:hypothetical protein
MIVMQAAATIALKDAAYRVRAVLTTRRLLTTMMAERPNAMISFAKRAPVWNRALSQKTALVDDCVTQKVISVC